MTMMMNVIIILMKLVVILTMIATLIVLLKMYLVGIMEIIGWLWERKNMIIIIIKILMKV